MDRRRSSPIEDLMDIVDHLPWWVGIVLAVVSYLRFFSKEYSALAKLLMLWFCLPPPAAHRGHHG